MEKINATLGQEQVRKIILLETDKNKKGDLFNRLAYDVFHALGFGDAQFNIPKPGREIDLILQHRTENRVALAECKAHVEKVGGAEINKFAGALDVERGKYERKGSSVVGYFISQSGFKDTVYEQEEERKEAKRNRNEKFEMILLGPAGIVRELIQGHVICSFEQAASAIRNHSEGLCLCEQADLLACEEGWIWVLYYSRFPKQKATHFAFVHADGKQLLNSIADTILQRAKMQKTAFSSLSYIEASEEKIYDGEEAQAAYYQYLQNELGEIQFEGMPADKEAGAVKVDLEHIFVPLRFYSNEMDEENEVGEISSIKEILDNSLRAAILAKPGGGKSTLIRRIALAYAFSERRLRVNDGLPDNDWFPVYIRCRDLESNATKSILEIIGTIVQRAEITKYEYGFKVLIEHALQDGRILLLIDGLDEISEERYRICFADQLRTFVATYPSVHLLITSREAGFRAVAGTIASYCKRYSICGLSKNQIRLLSLKWHQAILGDSKQVKADSDNLCAMILRDPRIVALAENPLLLTTLLFVKRCVGYLPTKRCRLYEEMIKLLLVTWNASAHDKLDMDETEPQLAFVAYCMMEQGLQKITRDRLESDIINARKELPEILSYTTVSPSKFIEQVEERSSLLIQMGFEENQNGQMVASYEFSHLSFQEYLAAKAVMKQWVPDSYNKNLMEMLMPHIEEDHWREVIPLAAVLYGRDAKPLIEYLANIVDEKLSTDDRNYKNEDKYFDMATLHLANCVANEVPMTQELLNKSIILILKGKRRLETLYRRNGELVGTINVFDTIAKSKYGANYREIVKTKLFGCYQDQYIYEFSDAWLNLEMLANENSMQLDYILSLLQSENYQNKVTGALLMMLSAYRSNASKEIRMENASSKLIDEIFSAIFQMLKTEDSLSVYSAAWCIAWSGYGEADIIPQNFVDDIADRLVELWLVDKEWNLKRVISWGLSSICMPGMEIRNRSGLKEAVQENFCHPNNDYDNMAAFFVAVVTNQWSKKEIRDRLKQVSSHRIGRNWRKYLKVSGVMSSKNKA